jgi:hypothetical protein
MATTKRRAPGRASKRRKTAARPKATKRPKRTTVKSRTAKSGRTQRRKKTGTTTAKRKTRRATATGRPKRAAPAAARARRVLARGVAALDAAALLRRVEAELRRRGDGSPAAAVIRTIAAVAAGYRGGPGANPPWPVAIDLDLRVVEGLVEVYWVGDRLPDPERRDVRGQARTWAGYDLAQFNLAGGATARNTLAAIALGAWRPGEPKTKVKPLVNLVAEWYRAGLS